MARVVQVGGGIVGLCNAMLLAKDGHDVTVLERDPATPPAPEDAWQAWERTGVNQFRMLHYLNPGFLHAVGGELPEAITALRQAGALHSNIVDNIPDEFKGGARPDDSQFDTVTARRPVAEAAISTAAEATPGVTIRRGVAVTGLVIQDGPDIPHVVGVRTDDGEEIRGDIVIDACGRRSALPSWLEAIGAAAPAEEREDSGFIYYGRHFRSSDGSYPFAMSGPLVPFGTASCLTLPADNGTWGIGIITSAKDAALRGLRDVDRWTAVVKSLPLHAHWLEGEPIDDTIAVMAKIEDRHRSLVVDGQPVVTGLLMVGDSWACTNPSLGRGIAIGTKHAVALRDFLRVAPLDDPVTVAKGWDEVTMETVEPWYRTTLSFDRHRLAEIESLVDGQPYEPNDPEWELTSSLMHAANVDPDCLRAFIRVAAVIDLPEVVLSDAALLEKVISVGGGYRDAEVMGPSRDELVAMATG
jgi:2-polyprenyl-6-methoxyphenol hydroxylase-like FAD-dependent oxidoreductase